MFIKLKIDFGNFASNVIPLDINGDDISGLNILIYRRYKTSLIVHKISLSKIFKKDSIKRHYRELADKNRTNSLLL